MPIDFRTYTDPGVYIESITPPVIFTAAIEPTILAIVGEAPTSRSVTESAVLLSASAVALQTLGADPGSANSIDRLLGTQFVSGAIGTLDAVTTIDDTSWTVSTYDNVLLPVGVNEVQILDFDDIGAGDTFKLSFAAVETAGSVTYSGDMEAAITAALESLASIDVGDVLVTQIDTNTYTVEFRGQYDQTDVGQVTVTSATGFTPLGTGGYTAGSIQDVAGNSGDFRIIIEDEELLVTTGTTGTAQAWTVVRGRNLTTGAIHGAGQVVNLALPYSDQNSLDVAVLAAPVTSSSTTFNVNETTGVQVVTLTSFAGGDAFSLTYDGQTTPSLGTTPVTPLEVEQALEALSNVTEVEVTGASDGPFTIKFLNPNTNVVALTVNVEAGSFPSAVTNRGVTSNSYLDVEGERMLVTSASGSTPQTLTVVRGVGGTTARSHGAVHAYENAGVDYSVRIGSGADATYETNDDTLSLSIVDVSRIPDGTAVSVTFTATDASQFGAALFDDFDTVRDKYGTPFSDDGSTIESPISLAAQLAFANGATQLVLVASNPDDANPIQSAIDKLSFEQSVNSLAVLSSAPADLSYAKGHVGEMSQQGLLRRAFIGFDGSAGFSTPSDFISTAQEMNSERVSLVGPAKFKLDNGTTTPLTIAGYYAAAAVAGLQAGLTPQEPLTRKQVYGFVGVADQASQADIFSMQSKGVLVVYEDRFGRLVVKHGLTTDMSTVYTREISVVTARDRLRDFILETLEGGELIGSAQTAETPNLVMAAVNSALEESVRQGLIFDYNDVKFRFPIASNPTLIEVRFSYKPTLPLNYIHVQFSIDTSAGTVEFQSINQNPV